MHADSHRKREEEGGRGRKREEEGGRGRKRDLVLLGGGT
jgi:hypothetical protein